MTVSCNKNKRRIDLNSDKTEKKAELYLFQCILVMSVAGSECALMWNAIN
jgi:hypothetical protein